MNEETIIEKLDELIAATKAAAIPADMRWISAKTASAMLDVSPRVFLEQYACRLDFPKPCRVGRPRWKASEILEWIEGTRANKHKPGRKRLR